MKTIIINIKPKLISFVQKVKNLNQKQKVIILAIGGIIILLLAAVSITISLYSNSNKQQKNETTATKKIKSKGNKEVKKEEPPPQPSLSEQEIKELHARHEQIINAETQLVPAGPMDEIDKLTKESTPLSPESEKNPSDTKSVASDPVGQDQKPVKTEEKPKKEPISNPYNVRNKDDLVPLIDAIKEWNKESELDYEIYKKKQQKK